MIKPVFQLMKENYQLERRISNPIELINGFLKRLIAFSIKRVLLKMGMKILEIGAYPPPHTGWSVRIKFLKEALNDNGNDCKVLNLGKNRRIKNPSYIDVQSGLDYLKKLIYCRLKGYHFHIHMNGQAVKGPILSLIAQIISLLTLRRTALTFHGGIEQQYFPKNNAGHMFWIIYFNFLLSKIIVCNNNPIKRKIEKYGPLINKIKIYAIPAFSVQYLSYKPTKIPERVEKYIKDKEKLILCYIILRNGFYIETVIEYLRKLKNLKIGVILSGIREAEDDEVIIHYDEIKKLESLGRVLTVCNLDHDQFMNLLEKTDIYLRTPISDGVASSVLEALSQKVPVVASENYRRPESVLTYHADDVDDLIQKMDYVLANIKQVKKEIVIPKIKDTVRDELELLEETFSKY